VCIASRSTVPLILLALAAGGCGEHRDARQRATPTPADARTPTATVAGGASGAAWTRAELMGRLPGRRIHIGTQTVRVDAATVTCTGVGAPTERRAGAPAWPRFRCVQPTFPPGSVAGPDAIFFVAPADRKRLAVTDQRLTRY
jgi:hypothetical protein